MFESEKVEISLVLLKFLADEVKVVSKLIVLLSNKEKVISRDGLNDAVGSCHKLLKLLSIITDESISVETRTLNLKVEKRYNLQY